MEKKIRTKYKSIMDIKEFDAMLFMDEFNWYIHPKLQSSDMDLN